MAKFRLYKFGKRENIYRLVHGGQLYLNAASRYADTGLSRGAHDPAEHIWEQQLPSAVTLEAFDGKTGKPKGVLHPIKVGPLSAELESDYYVFCMTLRYAVDFYDEFDADTCLVIDDADLFMDQALAAIQDALPNWAVDAGTVRYRSPNSFYTLYPVRQDIYYNKIDRYSHQQEVRIVCTPPKPIPKLTGLTVDIGSLYGYTHITGREQPDRMIQSEHSEAIGSPFRCHSSR